MKRKGYIKAEMNRVLSFTDSEECWAQAVTRTGTIGTGAEKCDFCVRVE